MTNGRETHASETETAIAQASDHMITMSVQRHAETEVQREAQAIISNAAWAALTPKEQEASIAHADATYEAHFAERAAEAEREAEEAGWEADAEPEAGG